MKKVINIQCLTQKVIYEHRNAEFYKATIK